MSVKYEQMQKAFAAYEEVFEKFSHFDKFSNKQLLRINPKVTISKMKEILNNTNFLIHFECYDHDPIIEVYYKNHPEFGTLYIWADKTVIQC